jgi:hypothetical protein
LERLDLAAPEWTDRDALPELLVSPLEEPLPAEEVCLSALARRLAAPAISTQ